MTRHLYQRTRGFTLVELLVVITIIAILAGLLTVTVGGVMNRARVFAVQLEMRQMEGALDKFNTQYGFYPPSFKGITAGLVMTNASDRVTAADRLLPFINRIAPNHSEDTTIPDGSGETYLLRWFARTGQYINWSTGEDLVFWLSGLNKNKQFPLTGGLPDGYVAYNGQDANGNVIEREVFFEFQAGQLAFNTTSRTRPLIDTSITEPTARTAGYHQGAGNRLTLTYQDGSDAPFDAAPYLYLDAPNYVPFDPTLATSNDGAYANPRYNDGTGLVNVTIDEIRNASSNSAHWTFPDWNPAKANSLFERIYANPKSFQLITFGIDGVSKTDNGSDANPNKWSDVGPAGTDNIVNFAGDGPNTLETMLLGTN